MQAATVPRTVGDATPYFYIGDSHAVVGTQVFEFPGEAKPLVVTSTQLIRGFCAADMLDENGLLGAAPVDVLRSVMAFSSGADFEPIDGLPTVMTTDGKARIEERLSITPFANERPYIFCVGEIDARYVIRWLASEGGDFDLPTSLQLEGLPGYVGERQFGTDEVLRIVAQQLDPLFRGLRILRNAGLTSIFLQTLPPPATSDRDAARVIGVVAPAKLRYKLTMLVNYMYRIVCDDIGIGLVDTWKYVTDDGGVLKDEFYLDGLHLHPKHTELSVAEVHRQIQS